MKRELKSFTVLILVVFLAFSLLAEAEENQEESLGLDLETTKATVEKWVEIKSIMAKEKADWQLGKQMLNDRVDIVKREIDSLSDKIKEAEKSIGEADKKRVELVDENAKLKVAADSLKEPLVNLESGIVELLAKLPNPIKNRVKPLSQRLPKDPDDTKLSLSQRFQNVLGILNEINKFNGEITTTSELRNLDDGSSVEVTAVYLGISHGFYVSSNGKYAGVGGLTDDGWKWESVNKSAAEIADMVAILKNEKVASFVQLPIEIK